jgi:non-canonical poly(A) RNA polymerase PAPD5/7
MCSDIDMTLELPGNVPNHRIHSILSRAANSLRRSRQFINVEFVSSARVPIVKAIHRQLGIPIDISASQLAGHTTVETVKEFLVTYPALRPLVFVLKVFFYNRELNEVFWGGISSYSIITMLVCFFETHPLLMSRDISAEENLGVLLIEWFELFGNYFNVHRVTITARGFRRKVEERLGNINPEYLSIRDPTDKCTLFSVSFVIAGFAYP